MSSVRTAIRKLPWAGEGSAAVSTGSAPAPTGQPFWASARSSAPAPVAPAPAPVAETPAPAVAAAPQLSGVVDERSPQHIVGWVRNVGQAEQRVGYEVIVDAPEGRRVLARGQADRMNDGLQISGVGDGRYGFYEILPEALSPRDAQFLTVQPTGGAPLPLSPTLRSVFQPINYVALDVVDNCNLRCPFCVFDYTNVRATNIMPEAIFEKALRLLPYTSDGNFWLSCLHEATLHPRFTDLIGMVPGEYRSKLFFTTNLAKRMPKSYFDTLADSGIYKINISLESFQPEIYERLRKGAKHRIFMENWAALMTAYETGHALPRLRYNIMAYRSNLAEIPAMVRLLLAEKRAWQVEIRDTFKMAHIPQEFMDAETLSLADWFWLAEQLSDQDPEQVLLLGPPGAPLVGQKPADVAPAPLIIAAEPEPAPIVKPRPSKQALLDAFTSQQVSPPFNTSVTWNGTLRVFAPLPDSDPNGPPIHKDFILTNVATLRDPLRFFASL